jgi:hypothetical protein
MTTTREMLTQWFDAGLRDKADFMIVATDTFSYEDYPVYIYPGGEKSVNEVTQDIEHASMSKVMEVYDLHGDRDVQIAAERAWAISRPSPGASTRLTEGLLRLIWKYQA